jgi:hypothetical protein
MSFDAKFKVEFVPRRYRDEVARLAVLYPLVKFDMRNQRQDSRVVNATAKVIAMWRARTLNLRDHSWAAAQHLPDVKGPKPVDYMRNCRPNFVAMRPATRPCKVWHACPFCWGRMVQGVWDTVDAAFPDTALIEAPIITTPQAGTVVLAAGERRPRTIVMNSDKTKLTADGKRRITTSVASRDFPYHLVTVCRRSVFSAQDSLPNLVDEFCKTRSRIRSIDFTGAAVVTTVEYRTKQWHLSHRYLLMVKPGTEIPVSFSEVPGYRYINTPTRREVMRAVARTCKYSRSMLMGDPKQTVRILHAISGRRLRALYGCFRKTKHYDT